jgi:hypothetical protein
VHAPLKIGDNSKATLKGFLAQAVHREIFFEE